MLPWDMCNYMLINYGFMFGEGLLLLLYELL